MRERVIACVWHRTGTRIIFSSFRADRMFENYFFFSVTQSTAWIHNDRWNCVAVESDLLIPAIFSYQTVKVMSPVAFNLNFNFALNPILLMFRSFSFFFWLIFKSTTLDMTVRPSAYKRHISLQPIQLKKQRREIIKKQRWKSENWYLKVKFHCHWLFYLGANDWIPLSAKITHEFESHS